MTPTLRELHLELRECQRRLGTKAEAPGDFDRALTLAHHLNNQLTFEYLQAALEAEADDAPSLAVVRRTRLVS